MRRRARYKVQQFETRKNEEFTALGTEIQREEKEVQEIEDRELELMALGEKAKKEAVVEAEGAKVKEGELTAKEEELKKKKTELETRLADLMKEIETLASGVEEGLLNKYRRIMASKKDVAVVSVETWNQLRWMSHEADTRFDYRGQNPGKLGQRVRIVGVYFFGR